jgi:hypothetical protein
LQTKRCSNKSLTTFGTRVKTDLSWSTEAVVQVFGTQAAKAKPIFFKGPACPKDFQNIGDMRPFAKLPMSVDHSEINRKAFLSRPATSSWLRRSALITASVARAPLTEFCGYSGDVCTSAFDLYCVLCNTPGARRPGLRTGRSYWPPGCAATSLLTVFVLAAGTGWALRTRSSFSMASRIWVVCYHSDFRPQWRD